jgi:hypothetical protein
MIYTELLCATTEHLRSDKKNKKDTARSMQRNKKFKALYIQLDSILN